MKPRNFRQLLGIILFAVFAFGGTFSDWSCHSGSTSVTQNSTTNNQGGNQNP